MHQSRPSAELSHATFDVESATPPKFALFGPSRDQVLSICSTTMTLDVHERFSPGQGKAKYERVRLMLRSLRMPELNCPNMLEVAGLCEGES